MAITPEQARQELARRELERRQQQRLETSNAPKPGLMRRAAEAVVDSPILPAAGAIAGGLAGAGVGSLPLAGLGGAAGEAARQLGQRALKSETPGQFFTDPSVGPSAPEAAKGIAQEGATAMAFEGAGKLGGVLLKTKTVQKFLGDFVGRLGRIQSGVKKELGERLFQDPGAFFTKTLKNAGDELGAVRKEFGMVIEKSVDDLIDPEISVSRKLVKDNLTKLNNGEALPAKDLLETTQGLDDIIEATHPRMRSKRAGLFGLKRFVQEQLGQIAGPERAAAKQYARSALASEFRQALPVTKSGDVSMMRTLGFPLLNSDIGLIGGMAAGAAQSPFIGGLGISAAGGLNKLLQKRAAQTVGSQAIGGLGLGLARNRRSQ